MAGELDLHMGITAEDHASAVIRQVQTSLSELAKQAKSFSSSMKKSLGPDLMKGLSTATSAATKFGSELKTAADAAATALKTDAAAALSVRAALAQAVTEANRLTSATKASVTSMQSSARTMATAQRTATRSRIDDVGRVWKIRERSERAELDHLGKVRKERQTARREAMQSARESFRHGRHAVRSLNHPVHESAGFALATGAAAGVAFAEHITRASEAFDTSMSRLRMFAPSLDADAIRRQALGQSVALGIGADKIVDSIAKSVRDGVPPAIAESLPKSIAQTAQVMGGDIERLTDSLAEGIQEATSMGWIKSKGDARRFLNIEAGLSTTAGNTSEKTEQFIAAGGLGHGREMGLDLQNTMAYGAMLNSSGARTGQASARFMGQLSQNVPKLFDYWRAAAQSHKSTEESRAVVSAPSKLGYAGIRDMQQQIMAGPDGLIDFAVRLDKLDDKNRKLVLQGLHFSEQGGSMLAELGANEGKKGYSIVARAKELAAQKEANDYLTEKFAEWSKSLSFMVQQIEAGWRAIENEIGDVIKNDVIAPFRDWWVMLSEGIVNSDLKDRVHRAIMGFVHGLGFDDVRHLLDAISGNVKGFDVVGFMTGIGEGIRSIVDAFKSLGSVFGGTTGLSAQTVGRVATELLGLSLALRFIAPVVSLMSGIGAGILALKSAIGAGAWLARLTGVSESFAAIAALDLGGVAAGLATLAGGLGALVGAIAWAKSKGALELPKGFGGRDILKALDPGLADRIYGPEHPDSRTKDDAAYPKGPPTSTLSPESYWSRKKAYLQRQSYDGGDFDSLRQGISYSPSDAGSTTREAIISTAETSEQIKTGIDRVADLLHRATASPVNSDGTVGTYGGGGSGAANLRYGRHGSSLGGSPHHGLGITSHHGSGSYRGTPVPDAPYNGKTIDGLTEEGTKQYAAILGHRESGNRYNITNPYGFVGRWQMGAAALKENGYVTTGNNRALKSDSVWTGKGGIHSLSEFLANKNGVQDQEFGEYTNRHFAQLKKAGVIEDGMSQADIAGWLAAAHLKGVGGATQLARGHDNVDANGTSASSYRRMMQGVGSKPLGSPSNPVTVKPAPSAKMSTGEIAGHVVQKVRPTRDDARPNNMTSADNSTMQNTFHIHGAHDAMHVAKTVVKHLERSTYTDERVNIA